MKVRLRLVGRWEFGGDVMMTQDDFDRIENLLDSGGRNYNRAMSELMEFVDFDLIDIEQADECVALLIVEPTNDN